MTEKRRQQLRKILDRFYDDYDFTGRVAHDPIEFPHRYRDAGDIEISAFIASCLAYGKVDLFKGVVERILSVMGKSPRSFLMEFDAKKQGRLFPFKYRFNEDRDIVCLLFIIRELLLKYSSLEKAFISHHVPEDGDTGKGITGFIEEILSIDTTRVYGRNVHPAGLLQFFPSPANGSACKRMNLFLRWMVRDRDIDFGIWKGVPKNRLVIPLDTHIARIGGCLGLAKRRSADWKSAVEITETLKLFDPVDPLRYDFALCHQGISGLCRPGNLEGCKSCVLKVSV